MSRILPSEMESYEQRCRNANAWSNLSYLYSTICKDGKETVPTLMGADIHDRFKELNDELEKADADCHAEIWAVNDQRWKDLRDIYKALGCDGMNGHIDDFAKTVKERAEYMADESRKKDATIVELEALNEKLIKEKSDWYGISPYIKKKAEEHGISMHECKSDDWRFVIGFLMGIIARMKEENGERRNPHELK